MQAAVRYQKDIASQSERLTGLLIEAAKRGDTRTIETLIAEGANVNGTTKAGTTPLMMAASFGHLAALRLLQDRGAATNTKRFDGFNALTLAAFFGHEYVVRELLSRGADIHAKGRSGTTPEIWAVTRGFLTIADLLRNGTEGFSVPPIPIQNAAFGPTIDYKPANGYSQHEDSSFKEGGLDHAVLHESFQEDNADFDEGIRKVGETKWSTTSQPAPAGPYNLAAARTSLEVKKRSISQTAPATTERSELAVENYPTGVGESIGEGIRRVGQRAWTTTPTDKLAGQYQVAPAGGSFSPFSTLVDRLGLSWKRAAVMFVFGVALSGMGIAIALKQLKRESPATLGISPPTFEQPSSKNSQRLDHAESPSQGSLNASQEQRSVEPTLDGSSNPGRVETAESEQSTVASANHTVADPDAATTPAPLTRLTNRSSGRNRRQKRDVAADVSETESREPNPPAAITFVSKQPEKSTRRATSPNVPVQPTTLIEGSSTKKKVIQWP